MAHVNEKKKTIVKEFIDLIGKYPIIGTVNMQNLATPQVQRMRAKLRDSVVIKMTKRRLIKIAIDSVKGKLKGIEELENHLKGMPALIFTKENPFKLYKVLQQNKSSAPARAGQIAPNDIIVTAGPTSFAPGPVISELSTIGLKTGIDNGKVAIKEDCVVVKEGEEVTRPIADVLAKLGIEPMEIGLALTAVYEDGSIYTKDILGVDEQEYIDNLTQAHSYAFNLAYETGYPTKETVEAKINNGANDALMLGIECGICNKDTIEYVLSKANSMALGLKSVANV